MSRGNTIPLGDFYSVGMGRLELPPLTRYAPSSVDTPAGKSETCLPTRQAYAFLLWVGVRGLEPPRIAPHASETCTYTNSVTRPLKAEQL